MKIRTVLISTVVSAALVAGAGYGAYYAVTSQKTAIEVVPVSNVNVGGYYWGTTDSIYGTITSEVSQKVMLLDEYSIDEIYVEEGEQVKEGTPLFSYDMTLAELELELEQLSLQTQELTMTRLEKELEKLKNTTASASLESNDSVLTSASPEEDAILTEGAGSDSTGAQNQTSADTDGGNQSGSAGSVSVEVEEIEQVPGTDSEQLGILNSVTGYERLVNAIGSLIEPYGDSLDAAELEQMGEAVTEAVTCYRKNLADEKVSRRTQADGTVTDVYEYVIKDSVKEALSKDDLNTLEQYVNQMDLYQVRYVQLLLRQVASMNQLTEEAVKAVREQYDHLSTEMQEKADCLESLTALEEQVQTPETGEETGNTGGTESGNESESGAESESGNESESGAESESGSESESGAESETPEQTEPGTETESDRPEESESDAETESDTETESGSETESDTEQEIDLSVYIDSFSALAQQVLAEEAENQSDYLTKLGDAIVFYQEWLAQAQSDILEETAAVPTMEEYVLSQSVREILTAEGREHLITELQDSYREICLRYVQLEITSLDSRALVRSRLEEAQKCYDTIGTTWQQQLEQRWAAAQGQSETAVTEQTDSEEEASGSSFLTLGELLQTYQVILTISELDPNQDTTLLIPALERARTAYLALSDAQKQQVWNAEVLISLLQQYGLWEAETESETEDWSDFDDFGDFGGLGDYTYTAEELKLMIEDKEQEIKECSLSIREAELSVNKQQRVVDQKVVKSTMDGTVISIGSEDGSSTDEYFVKIANESGLYARGLINELALETIQVGDVISGMSYETGASFTAVIKEISDYPDPDGGSMSYGMENTNAAYYPFYALIENPEGLEEGEVEIQLSETMSDGSEKIYLENYFVRTGNDGKSYVYIQGEDQKLKKQMVTTGQRLSSYAVEIVSGLTTEDKIAFPYGKNVKEGAETKEVDTLESAYM